MHFWSSLVELHIPVVVADTFDVVSGGILQCFLSEFGISIGSSEAIETVIRSLTCMSFMDGRDICAGLRSKACWTPYGDRIWSVMTTSVVPLVGSTLSASREEVDDGNPDCGLRSSGVLVEETVPED